MNKHPAYMKIVKKFREISNLIIIRTTLHKKYILCKQMIKNIQNYVLLDDIKQKIGLPYE